MLFRLYQNMCYRILFIAILWTICTGTAFMRPVDFDLVAEESQFLQPGGKSYDSSQKELQGEAVKGGYYSQQSNEKGEKGTSNTERQQKQYAEEGGKKLSHKQDGKYYADKTGMAHGEQGYNYADKGSYAKGHDTKGHHNVRKIDEYKKDREFFDEDRDASLREKLGEFLVGRAFRNGDVNQKGHAKNAFFEGKYGLKGNAEKGTFEVQEEGKKQDLGRGSYFNMGDGVAKIGIGDLFKVFGFGK
ncbi:uncharacterized protein [Euwallacea fornicatus]|uniref:uncharacterized protein n=1 Tax=Euwallacea fornicatus TaxID=995702 RepID=UPI00338DD562